MTNREITLLALEAWNNIFEDFEKNGTLAFDETTTLLTKTITSTLKEAYPEDTKDLRVVVWTEVGNNYDAVWRLKLEFVQTLELV
jgi:hypothetical protein